MSDKNRKILKNTYILYFRQIISVSINIYVLRVIFNTLGIDDFGIYTVVAGIVAMASFLPSALATATQRYFSFALGKNDNGLLLKIFNTNILIYILIAIIGVFFLETIGFNFVLDDLKIIEEKKYEALIAYQASVVGFVFLLLTTPFSSLFIANEDIRIYANISIIDICMKLLAALILSYFDGGLIFYAISVMLLASFVFLISAFVARYKYKCCTLDFSSLDYNLFRDIFLFTGWSIFGQLTTVARNQSVTILLNQFFNPAVVAARAISISVAGQISFSASNINTSISPQLIKSYANNELQKMYDVIFSGTKAIFFMMWIITIPTYFFMESILRIWLKNVPDYAVDFSRLGLLEALISSIALPIATAARAPGKMKAYELSLGFVQLLIFFASWFFLNEGYSPKSVFITAIVGNLVMFFLRIYIVQILVGLPVLKFFNKVVLPLLWVSAFSFSVAYWVDSYISKDSVFYVFPYGFIFIIINFVLMYYWACEDFEKKWILTSLIKIKGKLF